VLAPDVIVLGRPHSVIDNLELGPPLLENSGAALEVVGRDADARDRIASEVSDIQVQSLRIQALSNL